MVCNKLRMIRYSPRLPWPPRFPDVVVHTTVKKRDAVPEYLAAKSGDADAALTLALLLVSDAAVAELRHLIGAMSVTLVPVVADETMGFNAIPDALAQVLARDLNSPAASGEIVQTNMVGHTRARSFQRLVTPAEFEGPVETGRDYLLVDDHVGLAERLPTCGATFAAKAPM